LAELASLPLVSGSTYSWTVTSTDGGRSRTSAGTPFTLDTTAPEQATGRLNAASDTLAVGLGSNTDNYTSQRKPTLTGLAEAGAAVSVVVGSKTYTTTAGTAAAGSTTGSWAIEVTDNLNEGLNTPSITVTDRAGNETKGSGTAFTVDITAPSTSASTAELSAASDSGSRDFIPSAEKPTLSGTVEAGARVLLTLDGKTYSATASSTNGSWSITVGDSSASPAASAAYKLVPGAYTPAVEVFDKAGNSASFTGTAFTVQASGGDPVGRLSSDTGSSSTDRITKNSQVNFDG
jgi:hypothetical protein